MSFRKLRIAWSAVCVVAGLSLIALWVRGYSWYDEFRCKIRSDHQEPCLGYSIIIGWYQGRVTAKLRDDFIMCDRWSWYRVKLDQSLEYQDNYGKSSDGPWWFHVLHFYRSGTAAGGQPGSPTTEYHIPTWFLSALAPVLAVLPWLRPRFRIRTLLVVTALVAAVLGWVVWAAK